MIDVSTIPGARRALPQVKFTPMLASLPEGNFSRSGSIYEPKMDGMRAIATISNGACTLMSRRALSITEQYPSLALELPGLVSGDAILDGEIIALNEQGRPSFQHLQQRMNLLRKADIHRAEQSVPAYYFIFDIVYANGFDLCGAKLSDRKALLKEIVQESKNVKLLTHFVDDGVAAYEVCVETGFEGIVAKRLDSPYEPGRRSPYWTKVKAQQTDEFIVGGFTAGQGSRSPTFGALLLGSYDDAGNFVYCGSVGSGFDERLLRDMVRRMEGLHIPRWPFLKRPDEKKEVTWITPKIVIEIKFMDWTRDGHIRTPVFLRVREDKVAEEIRLVKRAPMAVVQLASDPSAKEEIRKAIESVSVKPQAPLAVTTVAPAKETRSSKSEAARTTASPATAKLPPKKKERASSKKTAAASVQVNELPLFVKEYVDTYKPAKKDEHIKVCSEVAAQLKQLKLTKDEKMEVVVDGDVIEFTHLDKVLWPAHNGMPKLTKRDFLYYITSVAPTLLGYLKDRPLSVVRSPDGLRGRKFYQKHWNFMIPDYVETCFVERSNDEDTEVAFCNNLASLLWFSQHGVMEHHVWLSRITSADAGTRPDFMAFDIDLHFDNDTKENRPYREDAFLRVAEAATWLKEALDAVSLIGYLKTSGRNGLHVFVPIHSTIEHDDVRVLAEVISRFILAKHSDTVTIDANAAKRDSKILLDCSPNCKGKTLVAPYAPRLVRERTVSTPIKWEELGKTPPVAYTMDTVPQRIAEVGDLWADWHTNRRDLEALLQKRS